MKPNRAASLPALICLILWSGLFAEVRCFANQNAALFIDVAPDALSRRQTNSARNRIQSAFPDLKFLTVRSTHVPRLLEELQNLREAGIRVERLIWRGHGSVDREAPNRVVLFIGRSEWLTLSNDPAENHGGLWRDGSAVFSLLGELLSPDAVVYFESCSLLSDGQCTQASAVKAEALASSLGMYNESGHGRTVFAFSESVHFGLAEDFEKKKPDEIKSRFKWRHLASSVCGVLGCIAAFSDALSPAVRVFAGTLGVASFGAMGMNLRMTRLRRKDFSAVGSEGHAGFLISVTADKVIKVEPLSLYRFFDSKLFKPCQRALTSEATAKLDGGVGSL